MEDIFKILNMFISKQFIFKYQQTFLNIKKQFVDIFKQITFYINILCRYFKTLLKNL